MAGGYYTALSGMHARLAALDRLAADIANASTTGYKTERAATEQADRPSFGAVLQSAVDVTTGAPRTDLRPGALAPTGRPLDLALQGSGFFVVDTAAGPRYTRNGHFVRRDDGVLATEAGEPVRGTDGPIHVGAVTEVDPDGTVRSDGAIAGRLTLVDFAPGAELASEGGARFSSAATPVPATATSISSGVLEQSNVSVVQRVAELSDVSRSFDALLRAVSVLMNDVDKTAITELGRR